MIGDVVGNGGRKAVTKLLKDLKNELAIDFVTLQGENLAGGIGLTVDNVIEMQEAGADVITTGNHVWDKREFIEHLDDPYLPVLRPLNYPSHNPGRGATDQSGPVAVVNLIGRVWVGEFDSPFAVIDDLLAGGFGQGKRASAKCGDLEPKKCFSWIFRAIEPQSAENCTGAGE